MHLLFHGRSVSPHDSLARKVQRSGDSLALVRAGRVTLVRDGINDAPLDLGDTDHPVDAGPSLAHQILDRSILVSSSAHNQSSDLMQDL
jgi:hypothetical protein